jgi:hypothetical protein
MEISGKLFLSFTTNQIFMFYCILLLDLIRQIIIIIIIKNFL